MLYLLLATVYTVAVVCTIKYQGTARGRGGRGNYFLLVRRVPCGDDSIGLSVYRLEVRRNLARVTLASARRCSVMSDAPWTQAAGSERADPWKSVT